MPAGINDDLYITNPRNQFQRIKVNLNVLPNLKAPIQKGQTLGNITVILNNQIIAKQPLVALTANPSGNIWRKSIDTVSHLFHKWFGASKDNIKVNLETNQPNKTSENPLKKMDISASLPETSLTETKTTTKPSPPPIPTKPKNTQAPVS